MKRPEITPGKWRKIYPGAFSDSALIYTSEDDAYVASVKCTTDAKAIAAIPDMMDALEEAWHWAKYEHDEGWNRDRLSIIQAAMKKAGYTFKE